jgi:hypothetical protein
MTEMITFAAKWWADQLRKPQSQSTNMGARGEHRVMTDVLTCTLNSLTEEQINTFEITLRDLFLNGDKENIPITKAMEKGSYFSTVGVDYHPGPYLSEAAKVAFGKPGFGILPFKTMMWFSPTELTVRVGHGAEIEVIFKNEKK